VALKKTINVIVAADLHSKIKIAAAQDGISIQEFVNKILMKAIEGRKK
jgi:predicted HicB family RNase H-like nuclease